MARNDCRHHKPCREHRGTEAQKVGSRAEMDGIIAPENAASGDSSTRFSPCGAVRIPRASIANEWAGSFRTSYHYREATGRASSQSRNPLAYAAHIPRRPRHASRTQEDRVDFACPAPRWLGTWPARTLRESREWSHTDTRHDGASSIHGRSRLLQSGEELDRGCRGDRGRAAGTSGRVRGEPFGGRLRVQCPCFRLPPSCATASLDPLCPASSCSFTDSQAHRRKWIGREVMDTIKRDRRMGREPRRHLAPDALLCPDARPSTWEPRRCLDGSPWLLLLGRADARGLRPSGRPS